MQRDIDRSHVYKNPATGEVAKRKRDYKSINRGPRFQIASSGRILNFIHLYLVRVRWEDLPARGRPDCAAGALANLDLLVLLDQAKRTEKKKKLRNPKT